MSHICFRGASQHKIICCETSLHCNMLSTVCTDAADNENSDVIHGLIHKADFRAFREVTQATEDEELWNQNSAGWTFLHTAASVNLPLSWWRFIVDRLSCTSERFWDVRTDSGENCLAILSQTYVRPKPWQSHSVKRAAVACKEELYRLLSDDDLQHQFCKREQALPFVQEFWSILRLLQDKFGGLGKSMTAFLARGGCCPSELVRLSVALDRSSLSTNSLGGVLCTWASCEASSGIDELLDQVIEADPQAPFYVDPVTRRHPCHFAILSGKRIEELVRLFLAAPSLIEVVDPVTKLPWVGLMVVARKESSILRARREAVGKSGFQGMFKLVRQSRQLELLEKAELDIDLGRLTAIYRILRFYPGAIS